MAAALCALLLGGSAPGSASTVVTSMDAKRFGAWGARFTVVSTCTSPNQIEEHETIAGTVEACDTVTATGTVSSSATLRAGDRVVLGSGFNVASGATLAVQIEPSLFPDAYLQDDTPDGETIYAARFYIDPTNLTLGSTDDFVHFEGRDAAGEVMVRLGIKLNDTMSELRAFVEAASDGGQLLTTEGAREVILASTGPGRSSVRIAHPVEAGQDLPAGWHWVEVGWQAASAPNANDGMAYVCVDDLDTGCADLSNLDNDEGTIDSVRWGAMDVAESLGSFDVDEFESQRALSIGQSPQELP